MNFAAALSLCICVLSFPREVQLHNNISFVYLQPNQNKQKIYAEALGQLRQVSAKRMEMLL